MGARLGAVLSETHDVVAERFFFVLAKTKKSFCQNVLNGLLGDARLIAAHCALFDDVVMMVN